MVIKRRTPQNPSSPIKENNKGIILTSLWYHKSIILRPSGIIQVYEKYHKSIVKVSNNIDNYLIMLYNVVSSTKGHYLWT